MTRGTLRTKSGRPRRLDSEEAARTGFTGKTFAHGSSLGLRRTRGERTFSRGDVTARLPESERRDSVRVKARGPGRFWLGIHAGFTRPVVLALS